MPSELEVPSPCIGDCRLDERQLCTGCRRHVSEIAEWPRATSARRIDILRAVALRTVAAGDANAIRR
jgi:predicted Fe-S protein YdhL (DUF1289 family)